MPPRYDKLSNQDDDLLELNQNHNANSSTNNFIISDVPGSGGSHSNNLNSSENLPAPNNDISPNSDKSSHMFQISFYHKYFDLDTQTFISRVQKALNPWGDSFFDERDASYESSTEMYGFVWVTGTLILLIFMSSTGSTLISEWLHSKEEHKKYEYDFSLLTKSIALFYGYTFLVPLLIHLAFRYRKGGSIMPSLTRLISIFSYSNILWIPITAINILIAFIGGSGTVLEWIIVLSAGFITGLSILKKLSPLIMRFCIDISRVENSDNSKKYYLAYLTILVVLHTVFTLSIKFCFY